jgi:hypothetical protein
VSEEAQLRMHREVRFALPIDQAIVEGPKREARKCEAPGCVDPLTGQPRATREYKPYCKKHLGLLPYAAQVMEELKRIPRGEDWRPRKKRCKGCPVWFLAKHPQHKFHEKACGKRHERKVAAKKRRAS